MANPLKTSFVIDTQPAWQLCRLLRLDGALLNEQPDFTPEQWAEIIQSAVWFGLAPVFYQRIKRLGLAEQVPEQSWRRLKNVYLTSSARVLLRQRELLKVIRAFQAKGIRTVALKGIHLAEAVYQEPALRLMSDLDLMVPKEDLLRAAEAIEALGYRPAKKYWVEFETSVSHQLPFFEKPGCHPIELHWTILSPKLPFNVDLAGLWERSCPLQIGNIDGLGLAREDFLLHIAVHAATQHHLAGGLRLVYDVAAMLDRFRLEFDWSILRERSAEWNAQAPLYLMLALSQRIFGTAAPVRFMDSIRPERYEPKWIEAAEDLLFLSQESYTAFSTNLATFLNTSRWDQKFQLFLRQVFLTREEMAAVYPVLPNSPKVLFYYPVRFKTLLGKHIAPIMRTLRGDSQVRESIRLANRLHESEDYLQHQLTSS